MGPDSAETSSRTDRNGAAPDGGASTGEIDPLRLVNAVLRYRRTVLAVPLVLAFLAGVYLLFQPNLYSSSAWFMPSGGDQPIPELAGIAGRIGISLPASSSSRSPQFYAELIRSRSLLAAVTGTEYSVGGDGPEDDERTGTLVEFFEVEGETSAERKEKAIERLREKIAIETDPETGIVKFTASTEYPELSHQIADRVLDLVNRFDLEQRQTQAGNEREFLASRLDEAREELRAVEDSLRRFVEENRRYQESPQLQLEYDRLRRQVDFKQQVTTSLVQSLEQARIREVQSTPVVTLVDPPVVPVEEDRRYLILKLLGVMVVGGGLAIIVAFVRDYLDAAERSEQQQALEFQEHLAQVREEVDTVLGWFRRRWEALWSRSS